MVRYFLLFAKMTSIHFLLSLVAAYDVEVDQMDVMTNFLHVDLEEEIVS